MHITYLINIHIRGILQSDLMDKAKYSERPTDIVLTGTLREEVSETSLRRKSNAKSKVKRSSKCWTFDYYVVHPTLFGSYKCYHNRQLPNGTLAAHTNTYLSLLPPGPDEVRKIYVAQEPFVQHLLLWASPTEDALGREFIPNIADLWLQDAATFPTSTWRREGDSNP